MNTYPDDFRDPKTAWSAPSERFTILEFNLTEVALENERANQTANAAVLPTYRVHEEDKEFFFTSSQCQVEPWNNVKTEIIPNVDLHKKFLDESKINHKNSPDFDFLHHEKLSILAAFASKEHITLTLTSESFFGTPVFCRYFDCHRNEIQGAEHASLVFPKSTISCPRRIGAEFISATRNMTEKAEYTVKVEPRIQLEHYFTVCMSTLYGEEPKFLQIAEFIEYYKLQGATFFHIYVRNISDYDRILLDDYVRTGEVEVIKMHDHYWRHDWMWHNVQVNDCHYRNKFFSKWTAISNIYDRIKMENDNIPTIKSLLDQFTFPSNLIELRFKTQTVVKVSDSPAVYTSEDEITNELLYKKYPNVTKFDAEWNEEVFIIRPERVAHVKTKRNSTSEIDSVFDKLSLKRTIVNETIAVVRRYDAHQTFNSNDAVLNLVENHPDGPRWFNLKNPLMEITDSLTTAIVDRVSWVYGTVKLTEEEMESSRKNYTELSVQL